MIRRAFHVLMCPFGAATKREALALGLVGIFLARALAFEGVFAWCGIGLAILYVFGLLRLLLFGVAK